MRYAFGVEVNVLRLFHRTGTNFNVNGPTVNPNRCRHCFRRAERYGLTRSKCQRKRNQEGNKSGDSN